MDGRDLTDIGEILASAFFHELVFGATVASIKRELIAMAHENKYQPVIDYLDSLVWDETPRIDKWLADYCGADDTELTASSACKLLIAGVRGSSSLGSSLTPCSSSKVPRARASPVSCNASL